MARKVLETKSKESLTWIISSSIGACIENAIMSSSRLHEVLTIGMHARGGKRAHDGTPLAKHVTDMNDPIFLLAVKDGINNELLNLVDPPDPGAAYYEQQNERMRGPDPGFYWADEDYSIPKPSPEVVDAYNKTINSNAERRVRLKKRLETVEKQLRETMSDELWKVYIEMLQ